MNPRVVRTDVLHVLQNGSRHAPGVASLRASESVNGIRVGAGVRKKSTDVGARGVGAMAWEPCD